MASLPEFLNTPTYMTVSKTVTCGNWFMETVEGQTLEQAIECVEDISAVVLIEGGRIIDVSAEAADLWWKLHGDACDDWTDVPEFIDEHLHNQIFETFGERDYNAHCWHDQQVSCNPRVL